ncbi:hypothetical protein DB30_02047 [Enhygromyxa salina]|uniref:Uncharacterized protein n=1 Tax=Enhygromyxa salina TaxID=215803 RepID=A0A0C2CW57_9BACT|nr:hypothetical protein [Enhygromyxa salina]KIG12102.1 hypothetical protein DB30_02047 [Enhygromyxa salina]
MLGVGRFSVLGLALLTCAGPTNQVPPDETQRIVVDQAVSLSERCGELNDLTVMAWAWAQLCWHRTAPELERGRVPLEQCRADASARGLEAAGRIPAGIDLHAPFELANNCPPDPPSDIAQLRVDSDSHYAVEDGGTITITFTNFCDDDIEFGFSPDLESKPPMRIQTGPLTRRKITIPRKYGLRGRLDGDTVWTESLCKASRSGMFLTFNADCQTCTSDDVDPLRRTDCVEAGSCPAPGSR